MVYINKSSFTSDTKSVLGSMMSTKCLRRPRKEPWITDTFQTHPKATLENKLHRRPRKSNNSEFNPNISVKIRFTSEFACRGDPFQETFGSSFLLCAAFFVCVCVCCIHCPLSALAKCKAGMPAVRTDAIIMPRAHLAHQTDKNEAASVKRHGRCPSLQMGWCKPYFTLF